MNAMKVLCVAVVVLRFMHVIASMNFPADIDECTNGNNDCDSTANFVCVNTPGSFVCVCATGYELVEGNCVGENYCVGSECHGSTVCCSCLIRLANLCIIILCY